MSGEEMDPNKDPHHQPPERAQKMWGNTERDVAEALKKEEEEGVHGRRDDLEDGPHGTIH